MYWYIYIFLLRVMFLNSKIVRLRCCLVTKSKNKNLTVKVKLLVQANLCASASTGGFCVNLHIQLGFSLVSGEPRPSLRGADYLSESRVCRPHVVFSYNLFIFIRNGSRTCGRGRTSCSRLPVPTCASRVQPSNGFTEIPVGDTRRPLPLLGDPRLSDFSNTPSSCFSCSAFQWEHKNVQQDKWSQTSPL